MHLEWNHEFHNAWKQNEHPKSKTDNPAEGSKLWILWNVEIWWRFSFFFLFSILSSFPSLVFLLPFLIKLLVRIYNIFHHSIFQHNLFCWSSMLSWSYALPRLLSPNSSFPPSCHVCVLALHTSSTHPLAIPFQFPNMDLHSHPYTYINTHIESWDGHMRNNMWHLCFRAWGTSRVCFPGSAHFPSDFIISFSFTAG